MRLRSLVVLAVLAASPSITAAQPKAPERPKLDAQADTNDSRVYDRRAMDRLRDDPQKAADALYWSTRLEPTRADALYARRVALSLADPSQLSRSWSGDRRTIESKKIRQIDSLFYRNGMGTASEVRFYLDQTMRSWGPSFRAWMAYRAARQDPRRPEATTRLAALGGSGLEHDQ